MRCGGKGSIQSAASGTLALLWGLLCAGVAGTEFVCADHPPVNAKADTNKIRRVGIMEQYTEVPGSEPELRCKNHGLAAFPTIRCAECASRPHPVRCNPYLRGAVCLWRGHWPLSPLLEAGPSGWFRRG